MADLMAAYGVICSMQIAANLVNFLVMAIADCRNFHFVLQIACFVNIYYIQGTVSGLFLDQIAISTVGLFKDCFFLCQFFSDYRVLQVITDRASFHFYQQIAFCEYLFGYIFIQAKASCFFLNEDFFYRYGFIFVQNFVKITRSEENIYINRKRANIFDSNMHHITRYGSVIINDDLFPFRKYQF